MYDNFRMNDTHMIVDQSLVMYSLLYSGVTVTFAIAVLFKFLTSELRLGFRSVLSLVVLFIGEPVCQFVIRGHWGFAGFAVGCIVLYATLPASHLETEGKSVLITGCDTGFGHALAKRLDTLGMRVYATCLDSNSLGAQSLRCSCSSRLRIMEMDVTSEKQVHDTMVQVDADVGEEGLWGVVNNAGIWYCAEADMMPWNLFKNVLQTNLHGTIHVTKTFLPLVQRAHGRIVFISSVVGRFPLPHFSAYAVSKAGISAFAETLRHEMKKWKVMVSVVEPNCFYTEAIVRRTEVFQQVWNHTNEETRQKYGRDYFDAIATKYNALATTFPRDITPVLRAVKSALLSCRPRSRYVTDRSAEMFMWLYAILPQWLGNKLIESVDVISPRTVVPAAMVYEPR